MANEVCRAIRNRRVLEFTYEGYNRIVEPHCHGRTQRGNECLRAYQTRGGSSSGKVPDWKMFTVAKMSGVSVSNNTFSGTRPGYNPNDKGMISIHCNL